MPDVLTGIGSRVWATRSADPAEPLRFPRKPASGERRRGRGVPQWSAGPLGCGGLQPEYLLQPDAGPPGGDRASPPKGRGEETCNRDAGLRELVCCFGASKKLIRKRLVLLSTLVKPKNKGSFPSNNKRCPALADLDLGPLVIFPGAVQAVDPRSSEPLGL